MGDVIIKAENISKSFVISHEVKARYNSIGDSMKQLGMNLFAKGVKDFSGVSKKEEFWALKDINFEIKRGDRVGIIGRNGAGKSTLLKVLSRITEPTTGKIKINGRVSSLLEVGTGFHPELSGRENIFLNGAILGMHRSEIRSKFDEIVAFAEVEQFLDTPVKRYSSGMYVRLAFAVAAHLEPEILIVDEVLAVGDAQFQKKCLGKMEDVSKSEGRTVLFVSHNMGAIKSLCNTSIILHKGEKILQGEVYESLSKYLSFDQTESNLKTYFNRGANKTSKRIFIQEVQLIDDLEKDFFQLVIYLKIKSTEKNRIGVNIKLKDGMGFPVGVGFTHYFLPDLIQISEGVNEVEIVSSMLSLATGDYKVGIELVIPGIEMLDTIDDCVQFEISNDSISKRKSGISQNWGLGATEITFEKIVHSK
jgi:lipopolysaccharide transport system ATP-binding protein